MLPLLDQILIVATFFFPSFFQLAALEKDYEEVGAETAEGEGEDEEYGEEY